MKKHLILIFSALTILVCNDAFCQSDADTLVLRNTKWDANAPAGFEELTIPSAGSLLQGFIYKPNGAQNHPTLIMLHGYPGNEKNLDIAQVVRAHGWNVVYFDYRGSWGSQGKFSFEHCVEDVVNAVAFCKKNSASLKIDTANIVLFGHSMGGWICLKALQKLPEVKKGFALSTWDIYGEFKDVKNVQCIPQKAKTDGSEPSFVLNSTVTDIFTPVIKNPAYFDLCNN